jgi:hypothetical protein
LNPWPGRTSDGELVRGSGAIELSLSGPLFLSDVFVAEGMRQVTLRRQFGTPFRAPPLQHKASCFGCHACAEPVGSRPFQITWLEGAFHL